MALDPETPELDSAEIAELEYEIVEVAIAVETVATAVDMAQEHPPVQKSLNSICSSGSMPAFGRIFAYEGKACNAQ